MSNPFEAVKITDRVYWVGAIDWDIRDFHGYRTSRGTTYNAFVVLGRSPTLIDTVKAPFLDEMLSRIASVIDPGKIETIVSNHSEMDHTGALPQAIAAIRPAKVLASKMGVRALEGHFHLAGGIETVADGQELSLGDATLTFVETRMCHWPDSMVTYLHEDALLFSQDAFGMHLAGQERWADEVDRGVLEAEAAKYYANILMPLATPIGKALAKVEGLGVPLRIVAPDHGPAWRRAEDIEWIVSAYARWAQGAKSGAEAVVVYDSMWQSTVRMAHAVAEGLAAGGAHAKLMCMKSSHRSDVATAVLDASALLVGSPTINNEIFPTLADVLTYLKGLKPRNMVGAAFGSYGWSGEAPKALHRMLEEMGVEPVAEPLRVNYVPDAAALAKCRELGLTVARAMAEKAGAAD